MRRKRRSTAQVAVLWRVGGAYTNVKLQSDTPGQFVHGVLIVRIGASLYFANAAFVRDRLLSMSRDFFCEHDARSGEMLHAGEHPATARLLRGAASYE